MRAGEQGVGASRHEAQLQPLNQTKTEKNKTILAHVYIDILSCHLLTTPMRSRPCPRSPKLLLLPAKGRRRAWGGASDQVRPNMEYALAKQS